MEDEDEEAQREPEYGGKAAQLVAVAMEGQHVVLVGGSCLINKLLFMKHIFHSISSDFNARCESKCFQYQYNFNLLFLVDGNVKVPKFLNITFDNVLDVYSVFELLHVLVVGGDVQNGRHGVRQLHGQLLRISSQLVRRI